MTNLLLLDCNKVSREGFAQVYLSLAGHDSIAARRASLGQFGDRVDILTYAEVSSFMSAFLPLDAVLVADIFWPTGQNICRWCQENDVKCFFWQHGQWIYTKNKKNPRFLPSMTFFFGDDIKDECSKWPYAKRSKLSVVGSPRYDGCEISPGGDYVYFSPPAMLEQNPSAVDRYNHDVKVLLERLNGLDGEVNLLIHPHYREGKVDTLKQMFPKATFRDVEESALGLVQSADKVLTHRNSTAVLDALACGKKAVLMNFLKWDKSYYHRDYFAPFAVESESPDHCLHNLTCDDDVDLDDYVDKAKPYIFLGNASARVADCVLRHV